MKILIIGQNPSKNYIRGKNGSIARLTTWLESINIKRFSFTNISICKYTTNPDLERIITESTGYDRIIALGNVASNALNKINIQHFKLPHPSGLNRQLNNKEFINDRLIQLSIYCGWRSPPHTQELRQNRQTI